VWGTNPLQRGVTSPGLWLKGLTVTVGQIKTSKKNKRRAGPVGVVLFKWVGKTGGGGQAFGIRSGKRGKPNGWQNRSPRGSRMYPRVTTPTRTLKKASGNAWYLGREEKRTTRICIGDPNGAHEGEKEGAKLGSNAEKKKKKDRRR